ncbi:hypothetical protein DSM14862_03518 (plasmid) [Sulfitobacter indolifex]|nr:hypothetical protein DSM14862_03518 [Sulfitobacter indolifex]
MNQKPSVVQIIKSVPQVLTSDTEPICPPTVAAELLRQTWPVYRRSVESGDERPLFDFLKAFDQGLEMSLGERAVTRRLAQVISCIRSKLKPYIALSIFQITRENINRLPPAGAHDRSSIVTCLQQVLSGADAHRMPAEITDLARIEPRIRCR